MASQRDSQLSVLIPSIKKSADAPNVQTDARAVIRERIEKNRLEERRRLSRLGQAENKAASSSSDAFAGSSAAGSSSRAGAMYLESCRIQTERAQQQGRQSAMRRQVAGPVPPTSWAESFIQARGKGKGKADPSVDLNAAELEMLGDRRSKSKRRLAGSSARLMIETQGDSDLFLERGRSDQRVPSLSDSCLLCMLNKARTRRHDPIGLEMWEDILSDLPPFLCLRLMLLAGSSAATQPMTFEEIAHIWSSSSKAGPGAFEGVAQVADDWDSDLSSLPAFGRQSATSLAQQPIIDLSFATITVSQIAQLLLQPKTGLNVQLRVLSLAGWSFDPHTDDTSIGTVLAAAVNLEALSLAGSLLKGGMQVETSATMDEEEDADLSSPEQLWLSALSRATPKLRLLDLSHSTWVTRSVVNTLANFGTLFRALRVLDVRGTRFRDSDGSIRRRLHARGIVLAT